MGGERAKEALEAIKNGDFAKAITVTLDYYDRTYLYGLKRKDENRVVRINTDTDDVVINAARVADAAREMDLL
jgi:tRNA 2-selenouridine synthase